MTTDAAIPARDLLALAALLEAEGNTEIEEADPRKAAFESLLGYGDGLKHAAERLRELAVAAPVAAVPAAVITATPTLIDGLVLRWRATVDGPALLSASRNGVMIHGLVPAAVIEPWLAGATRAHEALKAGRRSEAEALATHQHGPPPHRDLAPINEQRRGQ